MKSENQRKVPSFYLRTSEQKREDIKEEGEGLKTHESSVGEGGGFMCLMVVFKVGRWGEEENALCCLV